MNAAIVDDMATECEILRSLLKQYETNQHQPMKITEFHSGRELLADSLLITSSPSAWALYS